MKKALLIMILILSFSFIPKIKADVPNEITIHYFQNDLCDECKVTSAFFDSDDFSKEGISFQLYDTLKASDNLIVGEILSLLNKQYMTPTIMIGSTILQGSEVILKHIETVIEYYQNQEEYIDLVQVYLDGNHDISSADIIDLDEILEDDELTIDLPIFGTIHLKSFSLLLGAIIIGLVDGFNPCAMWVLVFLITMLINLKNRFRIWILGLTFILTSGIVYFLIMMAWFEVVHLVIYLRIFQVAIGILAVSFAFISFKHYWHQRQVDAGCEVTSKESRFKLMDKIKSVIHKQNLVYAIIGIIGVAITVNIIELACSAGLPAIYTSMLAYQNIGRTQSILYILVYVFFFILDDLFIFIIAILTFRVTGISNKYAKYSNLIGAIIMLFLGLGLLFFPQILF